LWTLGRQQMNYDWTKYVQQPQSDWLLADGAAVDWGRDPRER